MSFVLLHSNQNTEVSEISFLLRNANLSSDNFCKVDADASKYATVTSHSSHFKPIFSSYSHHTHPPQKALYLPYSDTPFIIPMFYLPHKNFCSHCAQHCPPLQLGKLGGVGKGGGANGRSSWASLGCPLQPPSPNSTQQAALSVSVNMCIFFSGDV